MERCNCLCPGCLRSNLGRENSADWFNSLVAALLGEPRRPDSVSAPAINTAVLWPDQLPDSQSQGCHFQGICTDHPIKKSRLKSQSFGRR